MCEGAFLGDRVWGKGEVAGGVVIEEEGWREVEGAVGRDSGEAWGKAETARHVSHWGGRCPFLVWLYNREV